MTSLEEFKKKTQYQNPNFKHQPQDAYRPQGQGKPKFEPKHEEEVDLDLVIKRVALFTGVSILVLSGFFSYDGFDQSVTGNNVNYKGLAVVIGILMAIVVTVVEFIFNTDHKKLNWTLKIAGLVAYAYSIWTNYLGIQHVLQTDKITAGVMAAFMDIIPETMISWALDSSLKGDFLGNILRTLFVSKSGKRQYASQDKFER